MTAPAATNLEARWHAAVPVAATGAGKTEWSIVQPVAAAGREATGVRLQKRAVPSRASALRCQSAGGDTGARDDASTLLATDHILRKGWDRVKSPAEGAARREIGLLAGSKLQSAAASLNSNAQLWAAEIGGTGH